MSPNPPIDPCCRPLENETTFGLMFDSNPLPMWVYDAATLHFVAVNDAAIRQYGYSREEFADLTITQLCVADEIAALAQELENSTEMEINQTAVWKHRKKDATVIDVELTWNRIPFAGKSAILVLAHDITERKRAEKRIREQASLLDLAHDAIIVIDLDDRVAFWNKGAESLYARLSADAVGRKLSDLVKQQAGIFEAAKGDLLVCGEWKGETRHTAGNDREIAVSSRWTLVRADDGEPKSILVINTDITEKKKLEGQFLRSQRLESIGTLASGIAHDLNNILAPILMSTGLLRRSIPDEESQTLLSTIEISAERGADIVKQVLTFARGAEGDRPSRRTSASRPRSPRTSPLSPATSPSSTRSS
jgi:two-component system cell cycle sensor histidine kinase/response regulator CckA